MFLSFGFWQGRHGGGDNGSRAPHASGGGVEAGRLAFKLGLVAFTSIFVASLVAFVTIRVRAETWRTEDLPGLPSWLWLSTLALLATSVGVEAAYRGGFKKIASRLQWSFATAVLFCVFQLAAWGSWTAAGLAPSAPTLYAFSFYMLTGLHGLHVLGGLVLHAWAVRKATQHSLKKTRGRSELVRFCAQYWHFLGIVWIVTWAALEIAARVA